MWRAIVVLGLSRIVFGVGCNVWVTSGRVVDVITTNRLQWVARVGGILAINTLNRPLSAVEVPSLLRRQEKETALPRPGPTWDC